MRGWKGVGECICVVVVVREGFLEEGTSKAKLER